MSKAAIYDFQNDEAWERVKHLPVNRFGYKHFDNVPNQAYRAGEYAAWKAAYEGEDFRMINLSWKFEGRLLQVPFNRLSDVSTKFTREINLVRGS